MQVALQLLVVYEGKTLYTAVWTKSGGDEYQISEADYTTYQKRYDELWKQSWRLKLLSNFLAGGVVKYTAIFETGGGNEIQVYTCPYKNFRAEDASRRQSGYSLITFNSY